jgi:hypothetical protein
MESTLATADMEAPKNDNKKTASVETQPTAHNMVLYSSVFLREMLINVASTSKTRRIFPKSVTKKWNLHGCQ